MIKILHLLAQLPERTGSGIYYRNIISRLGPYGYEQRALFAVQGDNGFDLLDRDHQYPVVFGSERLPFPVAGMSDVMPYESTVYSGMSRDMLAAWRSAFRETLERAAAEFQPDVVLCHHLWMLTSLAVETFPDAVKIGVCHNTDLRQAVQNPHLKARYVTGMDKLDLILALSGEQVPRIGSLYGVDPAKILPIGAGYDETLFYPLAHKPPREQVRIVFAGKIDRSKGILELIRAFQRIQPHKHNVELDIIGAPNGEYAAKLDALIAGNPRIRLLPPMPQADLADYLRRQDLFVMPSFYEGLGLIALESLASGLLVVATEIPGLMALLGDTVNRSGAVEYVRLPRLHGADQPFEEDIGGFVDALAEKLLLQVTRAEQGRRVTGALADQIQSHSWRHIARRIHEAVQQLWNQRS